MFFPRCTVNIFETIQPGQLGHPPQPGLSSTAVELCQLGAVSDFHLGAAATKGQFWVVATTGEMKWNEQNE